MWTGRAGRQSRGPWWTARRSGHAQAEGRPAAAALRAAAPLARAGARGDGELGHRGARQGHGCARLGEANAMEASPPRDDDGDEKLDGGCADSASSSSG